jgi:ubiquinone/menaquinone biosynthesis C-methylase UbiE
MSERSVISLFREEELPRYDLSRAPALIRLLDERLPEVDDDLWRRWGSFQSEFLDWTRERAGVSPEYVAESIARLAELFDHRGPLEGNVLDVGGGWGLLRRWWNAGEGSLFVVHDPALERFLVGPPPLYRELYGESLERPMTFVAGFGEELPYRDAVFDEFICAATLDHAMDPRRVLVEGRRCLRPGGRVLVILHCAGLSGEERTLRLPFGKRLGSALRHPLRSVKRLLKGSKDPHLHHFTVEGLTTLMEEAGFAGVEVRPYGEGSGARTFLAHRPE